MDLNNIQVFLTVAEEGSFRRAAERLGYTQAGISYIINNLEEETGLTLFVRDRSGVHLSPEGQHLLPQVRQLDMDNRVLSQTVNELKGLENGTLRVVTFESVSIHWLPGILAEFTRDFPGINIELISEEDNHIVEQMVLTGAVDCGFFLTGVKAPIDVFKLHEEPILAVVGPNHEMANAKYFPVSRLGEFPYIEMKYDSHTGIKHIFERHNVQPNTAFSIDNDFAALAMASKGLGFCVFPEMLLQSLSLDLRFLKFDERETRVLSIGTRSVDTASTACLKFIEYTRRWVAENV